MYSALKIAEWFLNRDNSCLEESISNLKLQKLLYYAQGTFLALKQKPLFSDDIVAWKHGPVVRSVYEEYRKYGADDIPYNTKCCEGISLEDGLLLKEVCEIFGKYSAWELRERTHEEAPWKTTPSSGKISAKKIQEYFSNELFSSIIDDSIIDSIPVEKGRRDSLGRLILPNV